MATEKKAYRFMQPDNTGGFKLVVLASSLKVARAYVAAGNSRGHRALRYMGEGHPSHPESWVAAIAPEATS